MLALLLFAVKVRRHPSEPGEETLWAWIEQNADYAIPIIAALVLALLLWAVLRGWRGPEQDALHIAEQKAELIRMMRAHVGGVSADLAAARLKIDHFRAAKLLGELEEEGKLVENTITGGVTTYRLRGL